MKNLVKYTKNHILRLFSGILLFALFLSFIAFGSNSSLSNLHFSSKTTSLNFSECSKNQTINYYTSSESESKITSSRREEGSKLKKIFCVFFPITTLWNISLSERLISARDPFLLKPFLSLEILSSRNHPPTFI